MSQLVLTSLTYSSLTISSVIINYSLTNSLTTSATVYLYRFIGNTIPSTNPTSGTSYVQLRSVTVPASSTLNSQTYTNNNLKGNTVYTYAFYKGTESTDTVITNSSGVVQSVTILTGMYVVKTGTTGFITYNSSNYLKLVYRLSKYYVSSTVYLYRIYGSTAPTTLDTSICSVVKPVLYSDTNTTLDIKNLISNRQHTFAFYNGNTNGVSTILYIGSLTLGVTFPLVPWTSTEYTTNQINTNLSANIYNNGVDIKYTITNNPASETATVYLYRFTTTPPSTLSLSGGTNMPIATNTINSGATLTATTTYDGISASTQYYYAFYNGNTPDISTILVNSSRVAQSVSVLTTGVLQNLMSASSITSTTATIRYFIANYTIANQLNVGTATIYLYYYTGITKSNNILNTATGTQIIQTSSPTIPIILTKSSTSDSSINLTGLIPNTIYSFQFYNGNNNGLSPILTSSNTSGGTVQFISFKTGVSITAINYFNVLNNSASISYTLSNKMISYSSYLYRFLGSSAPSILTNSGIQVTTILINSGTIAVPVVKSSTYSSKGLNSNSTYTYAFYNGETIGTSTQLTSELGVPLSIRLTTSNLYNTSITLSSLTTTSVTISYTLINNSVSYTVYLYRFNGSSAPENNPTTGTLLTSMSVTSSGVISTYNDTGLTAKTIYTYAFYNGNISSATNLKNLSEVNQSLTIFTTLDILVSSITPSNLSFLSVQINYTLLNYQNSSKTSYLYRFTGSSAPAILNTTTGTNIISNGVTTAVISSGVPGTTTSSVINNSGLMAKTFYTYAFYNGNTSSATILTNLPGVNQSLTIFTTLDVLVSSITPSNLSFLSVQINYTLLNYQNSSKTSYLYRFTGSYAPAILNTTTGTNIISDGVTTAEISNGVPGTITSSVINNSGLTLNTSYTYAFYNGNTNGSSIILVDTNNINQYINVTTKDISVINFTLPYTYETSIVISYDINNPNSSTVLLYIYRFNGSTSPSILDNTGTLISTITISANNSLSATVTDTDSILSNNVYTYAIYTGNTIGTSYILTVNSTTYYLTTFTFGIYSTLTYSTVTNTSANILYQIVNNLASNIDVYLYRFNSSSLPSPISSGTQITTFNINSNSTVDSNIIDTTLNPGTMYTYAFLNNTIGSTPEPSNMLDATYTPVSTTLTTTGEACFVKNTKILCYIDDKEVYLPIEDLKVGTLVKTYRYGYKKIIIKGHALMQNTVLYNRKKIYAMYKNEKNNLNEDLYVTGGHSLLVDNLTEDEIQNTYKYWKKLLKIEDKYLIMACVNNNFVQIDDNNIYDIYQIVLENDNYKNNYGIYANGVLTESLSEHTFNRRKHLISIE